MNIATLKYKTANAYWEKCIVASGNYRNIVVFRATPNNNRRYPDTMYEIHAAGKIHRRLDPMAAQCLFLEILEKY